MGSSPIILIVIINKTEHEQKKIMQNHAFLKWYKGGIHNIIYYGSKVYIDCELRTICVTHKNIFFDLDFYDKNQINVLFKTLPKENDEILNLFMEINRFRYLYIFKNFNPKWNFYRVFLKEYKLARYYKKLTRISLLKQYFFKYTLSNKKLINVLSPKQLSYFYCKEVGFQKIYPVVFILGYKLRHFVKFKDGFTKFNIFGVANLAKGLYSNPLEFDYLYNTEYLFFRKLKKKNYWSNQVKSFAKTNINSIYQRLKLKKINFILIKLGKAGRKLIKKVIIMLWLKKKIKNKNFHILKTCFKVFRKIITSFFYLKLNLLTKSLCELLKNSKTNKQLIIKKWCILMDLSTRKLKNTKLSFHKQFICFKWFLLELKVLMSLKYKWVSGIKLFMRLKKKCKQNLGNLKWLLISKPGHSWKNVVLKQLDYFILKLPKSSQADLIKKKYNNIFKYIKKKMKINGLVIYQ